jgi:hypothetical protein
MNVNSVDGKPHGSLHSLSIKELFMESSKRNQSTEMIWNIQKTCVICAVSKLTQKDP